MNSNDIKLSIQNLDMVYKVDESISRKRHITALDDVSLDIKSSEFVSLLGPSGCGKSTLLMIAGGLYQQTGGKISMDGQEITEPGFNRGIVFQDFAIFPWLTVSANIRFGMRMKGIPREEQNETITKLLNLVELKGFENIYPYRLSGGMKQRVGIARALAFDPELMLMDEPFGALDAQTRASLQRLLVQVWMETQKTILFVTHSVREAAYLSDRIVVMSPRPGKIADEIVVDLPRPRSVLSVEFLDLEKRIAESLSNVIGQKDGESIWVTD
tara:strand:+ start:1387 stop:2199 length:813 start_codon:yes stop_codon:yes gene_type:complete